MILSRAGYEPYAASNGKEAIKLARTISFHIIITDLKMPMVDGAKFITLLKNEDRLKDLPIIVLSSSSLEETGVDKKHIAAYLAKPIQPGVLLKTIENFVPEKVNPQYVELQAKKEKLQQVEEREKKRKMTEVQIVDGFPVEPVLVEDLKPGMVIGDDVTDENNISLMPMGSEINDKIIDKLKSLNIENILIRK